MSRHRSIPPCRVFTAPTPSPHLERDILLRRRRGGGGKREREAEGELKKKVDVFFEVCVQKRKNRNFVVSLLPSLSLSSERCALYVCVNVLCAAAGVSA